MAVVFTAIALMGSVAIPAAADTAQSESGSYQLLRGPQFCC